MRIHNYALALLAPLALGGGAQAQNYPTKAVHVVVPLAAGGAVDTISARRATAGGDLEPTGRGGE